jgi:hypothetical protein
VRCRKRIGGSQASRDRWLADTQAIFREERGLSDYLAREQQIAQLPVVLWRGQVLRTVRCQGDFGRGPHDYHVPESLLWSLIDIRAFRCAYHRP